MGLECFFPTRLAALRAALAWLRAPAGLYTALGAVLEGSGKKPSRPIADFFKINHEVNNVA